MAEVSADHIENGRFRHGSWLIRWRDEEAPMLERRFAHAEGAILRHEQAVLAAVLTHLSTATHIHASH